MAWGEHIFNFTKERADKTKKLYHEIGGAWPHWAELYGKNPLACQRFANGLWDHQIHDRTTGDFSRHAGFDKHWTEAGHEFPRYAGQMILTWAELYHLGEDNWPERERLLPMIQTVFNRMKHNKQAERVFYQQEVQKTYSESSTYPKQY